MVTYKTYAKDATQKLLAAGIPDAAFEVRCLLEDIAHMPHGVLPPDTALSQETLSALDAAISQRLNGRPLQYILGEWDFLNLRLAVGEGVLIPRQDTELLCETVADALKTVEAPHILDLCAGSGCVGLGIASLLPKTQVTAVEKSAEAFFFLEQNIARYPQYAVKAVKADILTDADMVNGTFDAIVSNPPYIPTANLNGLMREVQREPSMALDGGADGLVFYRAILQEWLPKLKSGGLCAVEIGFDQGEVVERLFVEAGLQRCGVLCDLGGNTRVVYGYKK